MSSRTVPEMQMPPGSASASSRAATLTPMRNLMRRSPVASGFAVDHPTLHLGGTAHRIDDARKLHEQAAAGGFDDAAAVLLDLRVARCRRTALWRSWVPSSSAP
jgi:hypothetical protein